MSQTAAHAGRRNRPDQNIVSHILLLPFGTSGSIFPFIWLGRKLLERGHRVTMIASAVYQQTAEAVGIEFFSPEPEVLPLMLADAGLWRPGSFKQVAFTYAGRATAPCAAAIDRVVREIGKPDLMLAPMISFGARIAREKHGIPLITVHFYPAAMMSADDLPLVLPGFRFLRMLPLAVRKLILSLPSPYDRFALPAVVEACAVHGVKPPTRLWKPWHHSPDGVLALFPSWYASVEQDHPDHTFQWDFPLEDMVQQRGMAPELDHFLTAGERPILFTPGTGQYHAAGFFEIAARVVSTLGCRAVFLTTRTEQVPKHLPSSILVSAYAPFSLLLPRAAVMVHHGGIGTVAQCFAAGIPQLVVHMSLDQPDNAARVARLGVGLSIGIGRLTAARLLPLLKRCLEDETIKEQARQRARHLQQRQPVAELLDWLEETMGGGMRQNDER
ncbi:MAG: glycosyltransferase [Verrucomicrobia bacterium]|nr:glycosyltransferase [Verrucomicrobiota bacterium]